MAFEYVQSLLQKELVKQGGGIFAIAFTRMAAKYKAEQGDKSLQDTLDASAFLLKLLNKEEAVDAPTNNFFEIIEAMNTLDKYGKGGEND